jgi:hypothetical protein
MGPAHQGSRHFCGLITAFHNVRSVNGCPHAMTVFCTYHNGRFLRPRGARGQGPNHDGTARWYLYLMLLRSSFMLAKASKRNRGSPPTMRMRRRSFSLDVGRAAVAGRFSPLNLSSTSRSDIRSRALCAGVGSRSQLR